MNLLLLSQICLAITIAFCVLLAPGIVFELPQGGLSNFGTFQVTAPIFSVGILLSVGLMTVASRRMSSAALVAIVRFYAAGLVVLLLSTYPYKINTVFKNLHIGVGFILAFYQLSTAFVLAKINGSDFVTITGLLFMATAIITGVLTSLEVVGLLFAAQISSSVGYAILLVHSTRLKQ